MSSYIQNYGFTKTIVKDNNRESKNEIQWIGDYNGKVANIDIDFDNNGNKEFINLQLDNKDLRNLLGIQPIEIPLEQRLVNDFLDKTYKPIVFENNLIKQRSHKHKKTHKHKYKQLNKHKKTHKHKQNNSHRTSSKDKHNYKY
jgi:hypothetical protein